MKPENAARALEAVQQAESGTMLCIGTLGDRSIVKHFYLLKNEGLETLWLRTDPQMVEWIQKRGGKLNLCFTAKIDWLYYDVRLVGLAEFSGDEEDPSQVKVKFTVNLDDSGIRISPMILDGPHTYLVDDQPAPKPPWQCGYGAAGNMGKYCMECARPRPS